MRHPPEPDSPSTTQLIERFVLASSTYYQEFAAVADRHDLNSTQVKLLILVHRPQSMRALAKQLSCDASNVTGLVDRLERRGLVRRDVAPTDRRIKIIGRTPAGEEVVGMVRAEMAATHRALAAFSDDERALLGTLLTRMHAALDES
ncbi:transcriptional regulator slyA [Actinoplanes sp. SE50]|uniref:MarR family winged helix-turn-helix transcriptional regulator n=1 Tax=unclassified Actinoplanes TaxID=2626549 RepID=UPI00023EC33E|nr:MULTISPECIES: MarR family transcriptional regulator [unclassified Actinoplanes]AEV86988.1 Transcriptional regulator slyA [Actinoplanes sp. SE50/110]ATO85384.1 transcriptional regulator slyA [Actinoplanes sp. SE50]SLM02796.1 MarR family transcriptional regulator [Actinoplanes sp. SE50/110]